MSVYMTGDETKELIKVDKTDTNNAVIIPAFDIHSKTTSNGNESRRITTHAYMFRYHLNDSNIFKALVAQCSDDINNAFHFITFGLPKLKTASTYRHQIKLQNNYLASMAIITIHEVKKNVMKKKVKEKLLNVTGISRFDETHMTKLKGKWIFVTNKAYNSK